MIMDSVVENISREETLRDMEMWKASRYAVFGEFETLWKMFRAVVETSSYGTSEYGGPVWILDFSLKNLKKFYPDNVWLKAMEQELDKGKLCPEVSDLAKSDVFVKFSEWFYERADALITEFGLGNVIVKYDGLFDSICFYGNNVFLMFVATYVNGYVKLQRDKLKIEDTLFSDTETLSGREYYTSFKQGRMWSEYPNSSVWTECCGKAPLMRHKVYGECYPLPHLSLTNGFVASETDKVKYLTLIVKDTMDAIQIAPDAVNKIWGGKVPYPKMQYLDKGWLGMASRSSQSDVFKWRCQNGRYKKVKVALPQIDEKYGEFWHLQFPLKQNWIEVGKPTPEYLQAVFR